MISSALEWANVSSILVRFNLSSSNIRLSAIAMGASLVVAVLMLVGKISAYYLTGSTAILSDAVESVIHIIATAMAAFSLWYASIPADGNHPYGHGKIAYFSAGFEGALILVASMAVIAFGIEGLVYGVELRQLDLGLFITASLAVINLVLGVFLIHAGKKSNQLILIANGKHVLTDMWTSGGVVIGVGLVYWTGLTWLDPLMAVIVGINILFSAVFLMKSGVQGLLDEADASHTESLLTCLNAAVKNNTLCGFHQLRHRASDSVMWVEVHFLLPDDMSNADAHHNATLVENEIKNLFSDYIVQITTHIEPESHDRAHPGGHDGVEAPFED